MCSLCEVTCKQNVTVPVVYKIIANEINIHLLLYLSYIWPNVVMLYMKVLLHCLPSDKT